MGRLYIISTPIGNLGDITYRAVDVLGRVDRVLAEDTRRTGILLRHYEIETPLVSLHAHNEAARQARILEWLDADERIAIVSDAGTPLLSDPGARIVQEVVHAGHEIVPIPGPSAVTAALVAAGLEPEPFTFYGFVPRTGRARSERLAEVAELPHTAVLFEAPNRLAALLEELRERCGSDRSAVVAREMTKVHETFMRGTLGELAAYYHREPPRGEIVVVLDGRSGPASDEDALDEETARLLARALLDDGRRPSHVARELAERIGIARNRAYEIALAVAAERKGEAKS